MIKSKYIFGVIFLGLLLVSCVSAFLIERHDDEIENKLIISPAELKLTLKPGQKIEKEMMVINRLGRTAEIDIITEGLINARALENLDKNYFPNSGADWIKPEIKKITLHHGERAKFKVVIDVPETVTAGGYYGAVLAAVKSVGGENDNIELINRVGTSMLMTIPGQTREEMKLLNFFNNRRFYLNGPVNFFTEVVNLGNIHLNPVGEIAVYNFLGKKVAQIPLGDTLVLPGQSQKWRSSWNEKWILGIYRAHLTMRYGDGGNQITEKEFRFWAFPAHVLVIIILLIYIVHKLIQKWQEKYEVREKSKCKNQESK